MKKKDAMDRIGMEGFMSKVVCDICGTAYADTADQCPICGTAKGEGSRPAGGESESGYAYVKGGRFAQSNVRKHTSKQEQPQAVEEDKLQRSLSEEDYDVFLQPEPKKAPAAEKPQRKPERQRPEEPENEQPSNIGLIIVVTVLLLAIISLCAYIAIRFIDMNNDRKATENTTASTSSSQLEQVPCTGVTINGLKEHTFTSVGAELMVDFTCQPANTTDLISWDYDDSIVEVQKRDGRWFIIALAKGETDVVVSCGAFSDTVHIICDIPAGVIIQDTQGADKLQHTFQALTEELVIFVANDSGLEELTWTYDNAVVSVTQRGDNWVVTPVASGQTTITVTCGTYSDSISIICNIPQEPEFVLEFSCASDITLTGYGTKWRIYKGSVDVSQIMFSSSDESVATVENGYVYIWKNGDATITAAYGNQVITMIVRARKVEVPENPVEPDYFLYTQYGKLSVNDVSISIDETLVISLRDKDGIKVTEGVTFYLDEGETRVTVDENGRVTGVESGKATVYVEYEGVVYKLIVRVKKPS